MDFKKYGIVYILLVLLVSVFIASRLFPNTTFTDLVPVSVSTTSNQDSIAVDVDFGEGPKTYENITAPNAYLALVEAVKQNGWEVSTKQYDFGVMVEQVGPYANTSERAWIYYVNGASGDVAADQKLLVAGDKVEWKYTAPN